MSYYDHIKGEEIFICIWAILMGAMGASSANGNCPDAKRGKAAAD